MQGRRPPRPPFGYDADHPPPTIGWRKQKISAEPEPVQRTPHSRYLSPRSLEPVADAAPAAEDKVAAQITPLYPPCPPYLRKEAAALWPAVVRKLVPEGDWDDHDF